MVTVGTTAAAAAVGLTDSGPRVIMPGPVFAGTKEGPGCRMATVSVA